MLATGFLGLPASSEVSEEDTVLIIGAGPTGICTLLCVVVEEATTYYCLREVSGKGPVRSSAFIQKSW